jgi:hypothetical protein
VRPSVLDLRFRGDAWLVARAEGPASLCLGTFALGEVAALPVDLPTLNRLLQRARQQPPRRRPRRNPGR